MTDAIPAISTESHREDGSSLVYESATTRVVRQPRTGHVLKHALGPDAAQRSSRERDILHRLAGVAGIVQLVDTPPSSTVIELQDCGIALAQWLRAGPADAKQVITLGCALARTVAAMHRAGVIHSDINPANIVLRDAPRGRGARHVPVLIDFDLAVAVDPTNAPPSARENIDSLGYRAPEQTGRTGRAVDQRVDLYALGAILYEFAVGRRPFDSTDALRLMHDQLVAEPASPSALDPRVPRGLSAVILRLLAKEPEQRYQSAEGLLHDLMRLQGEMENARDGIFVLGERDFPPRLMAPRPLVGRDLETARLRSAYDDAMRCAAHTVLIEGDPGVGKSALIDELRPLVNAGGGWFVYGKFDQLHAASEGGGPVAHALRALGRLLLARPPEELQLLRQAILDRLGASASLITGMLPEFGLLLGAQPEVAAVDPRQAEQRLFDATLDLLGAIVSAESPLVFVLDDLQWASSLPLRLFERLMNEPTLRGLLLVGAYRGGEVGPGHPLHTFLEHWGSQDEPPARIVLNNLASGAVGEMVQRMLHLPEHRADALGQVLGALTGGNPFDTVETVNVLRREGVLHLADDGWQWDETGIRAFAGHGNVVDMLAARVRLLPAASQAVVEAMSCLGGQVRHALLATAAGCDTNELHEHLRVPLAEGLVVADSNDDAVLRFRHDRVQQAVLTGLDVDARARLQLDLARRLCAAPAFRLQAARHYLECIALLRDPQERNTATALFGEMSQRLIAVANFALARRYLEGAGTLIDGLEPSGPVDASLRASIHQQLHLTLYSLGQLDEMDGVFSRICASRSTLDLTEAACLQMRALDLRGRMGESLILGNRLLAQLGVVVPAGYEDPAIDARLDALADWVRREQALGVSRLVPISDPSVLAVCRLLGRMVRSAYFLRDMRPFAWLLLESQRLWAQHGPAAALAADLGRLATVLISFREDYRTAFLVARHVLDVSETLGYEPQTSEARNLYTCFACHWFEPLEEAVRHCKLATEGVQASGDLSYVTYIGLTTTPILLDCAATLDAAEAEISVGLVLSRRTGNTHTEALNRLNMQFVRALRGLTRSPNNFDEDQFDESELVLRMAALPFVEKRRDENHAIAALLLGDLPAMARYTAKSFPLVEAKPGQELARTPGYYTNMRGYLVGGLLCAGLLRLSPYEEREARIAKLEECRAWLAERAAGAPSNFLHLAQLVEAEQAWALGEHWKAATAFDSALSHFGRLQRPWHQALITERAALFHISRGMLHQGRARLAEASALYAAWGATAKVRAMESEHPWLPDLPHPPPPAQPAALAAVDALDLVGLLRASQAMSSETSLDRLAARVTEVLASLTGATGVALLSVWEGSWRLHFQPGDGQALHSMPVTEAARRGLIPLSAFTYVERTGEVLRVDNIADDDRFSRDPYFAGQTHCSLLMVPITSQAASRAMLLLENRRSRAAFGAQRLDGVMLIAGQLAVSLANVQLYESLEQRVRVRTEELQKTQAQLVATARRAGMAEIASNVLHNVGNVLNSVNVAAALLERRVRASRGSGLSRAVGLMKEHGEHLGEFISHDERGRQLPGYLEQLDTALAEERREVLSELQLLTRSVDHIKAVVRSQQTYAGISTVIEPVCVADLLEEALRMSADATARHRVAVIRQFDAMPDVPLDKPRLLQILVNLIANASEAMASTPTADRHLTLAAATPQAHGGPFLRIAVRDRGHGIAAEDLSRVFSHGFTTKKNGHGFGLHSCALAAMEMGGKLVVSSDGPGTGAVFTLDLPLAGKQHG